MAFLTGIYSTEGLRHRNRALVLESLRVLGPASHTQIAEHSGLASSTITVITSEFLAEGVLEKVQQPAPSGRGRPRVSLALNAGFGYFVFVRISSEQVEFSLMDYRRVLIDRRRFARDPAQKSARDFGVRIRDFLNEFILRTDLKRDDIKSIFVTSKGVVDPDAPRLIWSPVFEGEPLDFARLFRNDWRAYVSVITETCLTAHQILSRSGDTHVGTRQAVLSLGDSIGLGVAERLEGGQLSMMAPSFGHLTHAPDGPLCRCGAKGCLETYAGFYGILRTAFDAPRDRIPAKFIPLDEMRKLAALARSGDRLVGLAFREAGQALGLSVARMFSLLGPMPVTIAGPGVEFFDLIADDFYAQVNDNLHIRLGATPQFDLVHDEQSLVFESAADVAFTRFDRDYVAVRRSHNDFEE